MKIKHYILFGFLSIAFLPAFASDSDKKIDSLENLLLRSVPDTGKVILLNKLSFQYLRVASYEKALSMGNQAFELSVKLGYKRGQAKSLINIGNVFLVTPALENAKKNYLSALDFATQIGDKVIMSDCNNNLGEVFRLEGNFQQALFYYLESLKIEEALSNKAGVSETLNNIGLLYYKLGNFSKAIENYKRSIQISREIKDDYILSINLLNMAELYADTKKPDTALSYYEQAASLSKEINDKGTWARSLLGIGTIYSAWNKQPEAITYFKQALNIGESCGDKVIVCNCLMRLGSIFENDKAYDKAIAYEKRSMALALELGLKPELRDCYYLLTQAYIHSDNSQKAFEYFDLYTQLNDSLHNKEISRQVAEMQAKYESEKKQQENMVLQQKNQLLLQQGRIQDLKITQNKYLIWGLVALLLSIIVIASLLVRQNRINARYAKIEMEQKLLRSQMNPHFIFNAMVGIQNYIYREEPEVAANHLSSVVHLMRSIIDNSKVEHIVLEKEISTLQHYLTLQQVRFPDKFKFSIVVDPDVDAENTLVPPMMAQPFIENAIVHGILNKTNGQGMISARFSIQHEQLSLQIEDNGIGRERSRMLNLKDNSHLSIATNITEERLKALNRGLKIKNSLSITDLYDEDGLPAGTRVSFLFPLTIT